MTLDQYPESPGAGIRHFGGDDPILARGEHVLAALEAMHAEHDFAFVEFPDWRALGLRSIRGESVR